MDWLDLLAVQGTLKSRLQQHSSKASILQHSDFFMVQLYKGFTSNMILSHGYGQMARGPQGLLEERLFSLAHRVAGMSS